LQTKTGYEVFTSKKYTGEEFSLEHTDWIGL